MEITIRIRMGMRMGIRMGMRMGMRIGMRIEIIMGMATRVCSRISLTLVLPCLRHGVGARRLAHNQHLHSRHTMVVVVVVVGEAVLSANVTSLCWLEREPQRLPNQH